eukprot:2928870-Ditylum_brightwellii.AAC.1
MSNRNFVGKNKEVGVMLGVQHKAIDKRVPFDLFRETISNYIVSKFKGGSDVVHIIRDMVDPMPIYEKAARPKKLTGTDATNDKMREIYKEELSIYIKNKGHIRTNTHKVYTL